MPNTKPSIVYVDMDDVLCNFSDAFHAARKVNPEIRYPQSQYGFFTNLLSIDGAVEGVNALIQSNTFEPYILTAPSTRNPFSYTEKRVWIEKYFGYEFVKKLIICSNKSLLKGDYLIDDNITGKGQDRFEGEFIHFGTNDFPDWTAVKERLSL